jgi:monovalent cation:H+ antiporter-2, CPA2 family
MPAHSAVIATLAVSLALAFACGMIAARLRLPPIVGYLLAGIAVSPFIPDAVLESSVITQVAELGVILLMFGVGLHFSVNDLAAVRRIVVPGAIAQLLITSSVGVAIGRMWNLNWGGALVLGISLAVASTVVLLKSLEAQDRLDSADGRVAIGWLVVEDLLMVLVLVLLPSLAPVLSGTASVSAANSGASDGVALLLAVALFKVAAFTVLMGVVGRRVVPWLLQRVAHLGSRELFTLAVLTIALGIATLASEVFGVSFALGAFFAGAVVSESDLSHRAATDALPLQDAFAVLFFLSVGMLFNPLAVLHQPMMLLTLLAVVVLGKFVVSSSVLRVLGTTPRSSVLIGSSLAQIGEFSFIISGLGVTLGLITRDLQAVVIAAALCAIAINSPMQAVVRSVAQWRERRGVRVAPLTPGVTSGAESLHSERVTTATHTREWPTVPAVDASDFSQLRDHVVVVGHGRVGTTITDALQRERAHYVIVEEQDRVVAGLRARGERAISGDATRPEVLARAGVAQARLLVVTAPEPFRARRIVELARTVSPSIAIAVRTHSAAEQLYFEELVAAPGTIGRAIYAEREAALSLAHFTLQVLGRTDDQADLVIDAMRATAIQPTETFAALHTREFRTMTGTDSARATPPADR